MRNNVMRAASLLVLMLLLPAFAHAALVNINTADVEALESLPHIGQKLAQRIIDYRTTNGLFTRIEDLQNVSGIGSGSNYADIAPLITVGDTETPGPILPDTSPVATSTTATTTATTASSSGGSAPPEYIPIPVLRIITSGDRTVSSGADTPFTAAVYDGKGNRRDGARVVWSFGDGMQRTGASVYHAYYYAGEYIVTTRVFTSDGGDATVERVITVKDARVKIASVSARGVSLVNNDSRTLDLSLWRLSAGGKEFKIPADTQILAGRTILFPSQVIQLPVAGSASLLYPSGEVAAIYPAASIEPALPVDRQPSAPQTSLNRMQRVEPITRAATNTQTYEQAVIAPTAATGLAAVGASSATSPAQAKTGSVFHSPWFISLMGVIALAGGAFLFL